MTENKGDFIVWYKYRDNNELHEGWVSVTQCIEIKTAADFEELTQSVAQLKDVTDLIITNVKRLPF